MALIPDIVDELESLVLELTEDVKTLRQAIPGPPPELNIDKWQNGELRRRVIEKRKKKDE